MSLTNLDRLEAVACPKCGAAKGEPCETKAGKPWRSFGARGWRLHEERAEAYTDHLIARAETLL